MNKSLTLFVLCPCSSNSVLLSSLVVLNKAPLVTLAFGSNVLDREWDDESSSVFAWCIFPLFCVKTPTTCGRKGLSILAENNPIFDDQFSSDFWISARSCCELSKLNWIDLNWILSRTWRTRLERRAVHFLSHFLEAVHFLPVSTTVFIRNTRPSEEDNRRHVSSKGWFHYWTLESSVLTVLHDRNSQSAMFTLVDLNVDCGFTPSSRHARPGSFKLRCGVFWSRNFSHIRGIFERRNSSERRYGREIYSWEILTDFWM